MVRVKSTRARIDTVVDVSLSEWFHMYSKLLRLGKAIARGCWGVGTRPRAQGSEPVSPIVARPLVDTSLSLVSQRAIVAFDELQNVLGRSLGR